MTDLRSILYMFSLWVCGTLCWPGRKTGEKELFEGLVAVTTCMLNLLNYDTVGTNVSDKNTVSCFWFEERKQYVTLKKWHHLQKHKASYVTRKQ